MVDAPWRRFTQALRWKGQAPQATTGAARVSESHCQYVNCRAGTIAIAMTGMESAAQMITRCRSPRVGSSSTDSSSPAASDFAGFGSVAP